MRHSVVGSMDRARVDQVIQLALATAGARDAYQRALGPIHLIKYVYLADLAFAETHGGHTYTGVSWRFHNFGPWAAEVFERIEPASAAVAAERKGMRSPKYGEFVRYELHDDGYERERLSERLEAGLPQIVSSAVKRAVREHGGDTGSLLRHVYLTPPMIQAAPGETLRFEGVEAVAPAADAEITPSPSASPPSWKQRKQRESALAALREETKRRLAERLTSRRAQRQTIEAPYDEVFAQGLAWLDAQAGPTAPTGDAEAVFSPEIWRSPGRTEPDVS
jgi:hypothetical protein